MADRAYWNGMDENDGEKEMRKRMKTKGQTKQKYGEMPCLFNAIFLRTCSRLNGFLIVDYIIIMTRIKEIEST